MKDFNLLESILLKNRNRRLFGGFALLTGGLLLLFGLPRHALITVLGIVLVSCGTAIIGLALIRHDVSKSDIVRLLDTSPGQVVWVYYYRVQMMPYGVSIGQMCTLFFKLQNREQLLLRATEADLNKLMDELRQKLPHATFGHSSKKEQLYTANPELLRR